MYKPSKADRERYAKACQQAEEKGFKVSKSTGGLSLYGYIGEKYVRISNHFLPQFNANFMEISRTIKVDDEIIVGSQKKVFAEIGIEL